MFFSSAVIPVTAKAHPASRQPDFPWGWELTAARVLLLGKSCHKVLPSTCKIANRI